ncbi:MAG: hypothetical protein IJC09_06100 [Clostridia bacterium]|nr:hypothetical protein [Clostridia bacterium]
MRRIFTLAVFSLLMSIPLGVRAADEIKEVTITNTGQVEVWGTIENYSADDEVTILMTRADAGTDIQGNDIMYINQQKIGNNGVFFFEFPIDEQFAREDYELRIGSSVEGFTTLKATGTLPQIPATVYQISNNAVVVGVDAYDLDSPYYESENIINSLADGGNKMYYRINDMWFDLLDKNCTSWEYLTADNEIPESEWSMWYIRQYYNMPYGIIFE